MTQDEITQMLRDVGFKLSFWKTDPPTPLNVYLEYEQLERFAALVAAHEREKIPKDFVKACEVLVQEKIDAVLAEREACAKVCEEIAVKEWDAYKGRTEPIDRDKLYNPHIEGISDGADECAAAIRSRCSHGASNN